MAKKERKSDTRDWVSYGAFGLVMMLLTYLLVARTPLRRTIPGYPSPETQRAAIENYRRIDSLEKVIDLWAFQVTNIQRVLTGREGGEYSFEVFAEMKNVCISMGDHPIPKWGV